jgi:hypothetical protein
MSTINANGTMSFGNALGGSVTIVPKNDTSTNYTIDIPDASGTVALTNDINAIENGTIVSPRGVSFVTFSSIPASVKRITVLFYGISISGTDNYLVRIGSGTLDTSGYLSGSSAATTHVEATNGFIIRANGAAEQLLGTMTISRIDGNKWVESHAAFRTTIAGTSGGGIKELSGELDTISILSSGTNTFDAGSINISWEF